MARSPSNWKGVTLANDRYVVRAKLGEGGMGYVYRALDRNLEVDVVVKVPRREMLEDPEFVRRFSLEIRSLVKLTHPCVVKITDVGEHDGVPYAVMQYLSGGSLEDYRPADGATADKPVGANPSALNDWLPGIANALDFVHSQGVVHRDVKPGNILFDAHGNVFLSDFGVAKALGNAGPEERRVANTGTGMVIGTPEYMAPELVMGRAFDGRIDQYALAITVYEMLCGRRPFTATTATAILVLQTTEEPPPPHELDPKIPRPLSDAVLRALAKDPQRRFPNCKTFSEAVLTGAKTTAPTAASPTGKALRDDQVRLPCPVCQKNLILPRRFVDDRERHGGKMIACPSCKTHLGINPAGTGLVSSAAATERITPPGTEALRSPGQPTPPTTPATARTATRPASASVAKTMIATPPATLKVETPALGFGGDETPDATPPPKTWGRAGLISAAVIGLAATILGIGLIPWRSTPKEGQVRIDVGGVPKDALILVDNTRYEPARLAEPLTMPFGSHEVEVRSDKHEPYKSSFQVEGPTRGPVIVVLTPKAVALAPPPPPKPEPEPEPEVKPETPPPPPVPLVRQPPRRVVSPGSQVFGGVEYVAVPENQPEVENVEIGALLNNPEKYSGKVVSPPALFVIARTAQRQGDGTSLIPVKRVKLHINADRRPPNLNALVYDQEFVVRVDHRMIDAINQIHASRPGIGRGGENASVLTFHVQKRIEGGHETWVPVLKKAEFILDLHHKNISRGKMAGSIVTLAVSTEGAHPQGASQRKDWGTRLAAYSQNLRNFYKRIGG